MRLEECRLPEGLLRPKGNGSLVDVQLWPTIVPVIDQQSGERLCLHTLYLRELKLSIKKSSINIGMESEQR